MAEPSIDTRMDELLQLLLEQQQKSRFPIVKNKPPTAESVEEKISLSDRFGLWIGFHNLSQNDFIKIIEKYCLVYDLEFNDKNKKEAIMWCLQRGNRTGRSGWQFILNYAADKNKKINY